MLTRFMPKKPHPDSDRARYRAGSWVAYKATVATHGTSGRLKTDEGAWLPNPDEIDVQIARMRWMEHLGLDDIFISSVMIYDAPTFEKAAAMIHRYGVEETVRRCAPFLHE